MEGCSVPYAKYILMFFNAIFLIIAIGLIAAGSCVIDELKDYHFFLENEIKAPPILMIFVGLMSLAVVGYGVYSTLSEDYSKLLIFAVLLLVVFVFELVVGSLAVAAKKNFSEPLRAAMKDAITNYRNFGDEDMTWERVQLSLECCGIDGPADWNSTYLPLSCCLDDTTRVCLHALENSTDIYQKGCFNGLQDLVSSKAGTIGGFGIGISFIQVIGIALALYMASAKKREPPIES